MKKGHNYNILDLGSSKLRFSIFDDKSIQQYSEIKPLFNQNLYLKEFESIVTFLQQNPSVISKWSRAAIKHSKKFSTRNVVKKYIDYFNILYANGRKVIRKI